MADNIMKRVTITTAPKYISRKGWKGTAVADNIMKRVTITPLPKYISRKGWVKLWLTIL